jgi:acetyltransferase-like isoleucine patch superfamily enzyme
VTGQLGDPTSRSLGRYPSIPPRAGRCGATPYRVELREASRLSNTLRTCRQIYDQVDFFTRVTGGYVRSKLSPGKFGRFTILIGKVRLRIRGEATFGARFMVQADSYEVRIVVADGGTLTVGDGVFINGGVSIEAWHDVRIGRNVLMAPFASVIDDNRYELEPGATRYKGPTVIGDGAWLGRHVVVLPGVTVGSGAVIGANSVVSRNIPPNTFAAGAPARVMRSLDLPDGWDHRFGYGSPRTQSGIWSLLRHRLRRNDQNGQNDRYDSAASQREWTGRV